MLLLLLPILCVDKDGGGCGSSSRGIVLILVVDEAVLEIVLLVLAVVNEMRVLGRITKRVGR